MQFVSIGDNSHTMLNPIFWENKKNISNAEIFKDQTLGANIHIHYIIIKGQVFNWLFLAFLFCPAIIFL